MILMALSAGLVGLIHSLAPGHWLPVVLMAKGRRWGLKKAMIGALIAAAGHIVLSILLGVGVVWTGALYLAQYEEQIEGYAGLLLAAFGIVYAIVGLSRHSGCDGHTHHGPTPDDSKSAVLFLFSIGFSPCVAVLPIFAAAAPGGPISLILSMIAFAAGVVGALVGATALVSAGLMQLDHPVLEHYGDAITGFGVAAMGLILFFLH